MTEKEVEDKKVEEVKKCIRCKRVIIKDFEKWKDKNPDKVFFYCPYCKMMLPVMRSEGVEI